jgi:hypothetical protein
MKRAWSRLFLGILIAGTVRLVACSDDGLGIDTDGGLDQSVQGDLAGVDQAVKPGQIDLAGRDFAGTNCGSMVCGSSQTCCVVPDIDNQSVMQMCQASPSCGDGGIPVSCDGPEDCGGGAPNCCVDISLGGMMNVMGGAMCTASCPASASGGGGGGMLSTKLCHGAADCQNYVGTAPVIGMAPFDRCCGNPILPMKFCAPGLITLVSDQVTCD